MGVDLSAWADDWLYTAGVNTLWLDRTDRLVHQSPSSDGRLREHHISIAAFDLVDGSLIARPTVDATVRGATTLVPELETDRAPDLTVLNAPASSYVRVRLDELSLSTLSDHLGALPSNVRAACWVAASQMVKDGRLARARFRALAERHGSSEMDPQVRDLLANLFV